MSRTDAVQQYLHALKLGQRCYKNAVNRGEYPYPPALTEIAGLSQIVSRAELGLVNVPSELIVGTYSPGRTSALAANFMPLLPEGTEFGSKWISLCAAHLSDEGIREPVKCYEYLGKFYVQEGNKRTSVLKSYDSPTIPAMVTRLIPEYSDDHSIQIYYEFMHFYALTGIYGLRFIHRKRYMKLIAKLGFDSDHVWSDAERRSFRACYIHFKSAFDKVCPANSSVTAAEALLFMLNVYSFAQLKDMTQKDIIKELASLWGDIESENDFAIDINAEPVESSPGILTKLFTPDKLNVAFIYGFDPKESAWTRAHELGRQHIDNKFSDRVRTKVYNAFDRDYFSAMQQAVKDGAELIFATIPTMVDAAMRIAALYPSLKVLTCSLSRPRPGVRNYYGRIYEAKFVTGAIAGAMADNDLVGYIANYPIMGVPAAINAFTLGARLTNPRARVVLRWSCLEGDPFEELVRMGASVISNREVASSADLHRALEWGTYRVSADGGLVPLAAPCWDWGMVYEKLILSVFTGAWDSSSLGRAVSYWWGIHSGVISVRLSETLPAGVRRLSDMLCRGIADGSIRPFAEKLVDSAGLERSDGSRDLSFEEIMAMDWLLDGVEGGIPRYDELIESSKRTVHLLGIYRHELPPEKEEKQI